MGSESVMANDSAKRLRRGALTLLVLMLIGVATASSAYAFDLPSGTSGWSSSYQPGEVAKGAMAAIDEIAKIMKDLIDLAVTLSQPLDQHANKMAGGLAGITVALAGVRYAATRDPVAAWQSLIEDLAILGIFGSIFLMYATWAPGFYKWFNDMAVAVSGTDAQSLPSAMVKSAGSIFDAVIEAFQAAHWWSYIALAINLMPLLFAWGFLMIASLVFLFFISLGTIQMAVGIVMGKIALALGMSEFTRGYFKTWLDYMISAGMYMVVAAILQRLVTTTITSALTNAISKGLTTPYAGSLTLDLSIFVLILSFEVPKFASMFGGGANASGGAFKSLTKLATKGLA